MRTYTAGGRDQSAPGGRGIARLLARVTAALVALLGAACGDDQPPEELPGITCERDTATGPTTAIPVTLGTPVEGFICPVTDQDWYAIDLAEGERLVRVRLGIVGESLSPVAPTYAIWSKRTIACPSADPEIAEVCEELGLGSGTHIVPDTVVAQPDPILVGYPEGVEAVHCLQPGNGYFLVVRDLNDESADVRRAYALEVTASPDPDTDEPNDTVETAIAVPSGQVVSGRISCSGDNDVYAISAAPGAFIDLSLTSPVTGYQPRIDVLDPSGTLLTSQTNLRGRFDPTDIAFCRVLPEAGTFYVRVRDDDGVDAEPDIPYTLELRTAVDLDTNEPNNGPAEATAAGTLSCATGGVATFTGTLGCGGDNDWYAVDLSGCAIGDLIEADVLVGEGLGATEAWELQREVQASVTLIRPDTRSACDEDRDCLTLNRTCVEPFDCAGFLESCLGSGFCAGAAACLPAGLCGASQVNRAYRPFPVPDPIVGSPPANRATISAPILVSGQRLFVRVSDFQADGGDGAATYRLSVTARRDPDAHEPNNLFVNRLLEDTVELTQPAAATPIPACPSTATGSIGYQNDVDWWTFPKTCPGGADCPLVLRVGFESGSVATAAVVVVDAERGPRFSRDLPAGSTLAPLIGGPAFCGYQFRADSGPYFVQVFDVDETPEDLELSGREWDPDQAYTLCYEAPASGGCPAPCVEVSNPSTGGMECDSP